MKKLWLLLGVVHTGIAMDAVNDDVVGVGVAGDHSQHTWADLATKRTSYSSTHAPFASHALMHTEDAGLAELMMTVDDAPISEERNCNQQADLKKATKNIWYKLHPQDSPYPKCAIVENAISPYENVYSSMNNRLNYFFGSDRAVNDSDQYLSCVHHKSLNQRAKVQNNFVEVLDEILDVGSRVALYGKDHPVVTAPLRRINQTKLLAKQIEYYHRFPGFPLLRHQTRKCWFYFHNRVLSELAYTATEKIMPFDNELTNITNLTRKHNWSYFHDRVLVQLVRQHCLKVIDALEAEEAYHDDGIKTVWQSKEIPSHHPRFDNYCLRSAHRNTRDQLPIWHKILNVLWIIERNETERIQKQIRYYMCSNVFPELPLWHKVQNESWKIERNYKERTQKKMRDHVLPQLLATYALKIIAEYKRQKANMSTLNSGHSSVTLNAASIQSSTEA